MRRFLPTDLRIDLFRTWFRPSPLDQRQDGAVERVSAVGTPCIVVWTSMGVPLGLTFAPFR